MSSSCCENAWRCFSRSFFKAVLVGLRWNLNVHCFPQLSQNLQVWFITIFDVCYCYFLKGRAATLMHRGSHCHVFSQTLFSSFHNNVVLCRVEHSDRNIHHPTS